EGEASVFVARGEAAVLERGGGDGDGVGDELDDIVTRGFGGLARRRRDAHALDVAGGLCAEGEGDVRRVQALAELRRALVADEDERLRAVAIVDDAGAAAAGSAAEALHPV